MFDKLSEELRQARERSGLSLQQISNKTKIDVRFLQAMEDGNFSFQPELYVKAFLKSYANFVGLDEYKILRKYQAIKEGKQFSEPEPPAKTGQSSLPTEEIPSAHEERHTEKPASTRGIQNVPQFDSVRKADYQERKGLNKGNIMALAAIAGVLVVFAVVYFLFFRPSNDIIVAEKPYEEIQKESTDRYADTEPKKDTVSENTNTSVPAVSDSLKLYIHSSDTSWVKITVDNSRTDEFTLFPGGQKTISAKDNYRITLGNSKAIQLQLNSTPLSIASTGRKVTTILVDTSGVHLPSPPVKKQG